MDGARIRRNLPVFVILMVALLLRASHLAWGLPALLHPDEHRYIGPATIIVARGDLNPHYFQNPSVMIYLTSLLFWALTGPSHAFRALNDGLNLGIPDPRGDFLDMVVLRGTVAVAGTAMVAITYLAGKELLGRRAALFGACLLAVSFLAVRDSHYATNDILATTFLALSLLFATRIYTRGRTSDYLLAGIFGGLGTSTKYNVGVFAVALLAAHLARMSRAQGGSPCPVGAEAERGPRRHPELIRQPRRHQDTKSLHLSNFVPSCLRGGLRDGPLLLGGLASLVAFLAGTPYALLDHRGFLEDFQGQFGYGAQTWQGQDSVPSALAFLAALIQGYGLLPLALAGVGIAFGLRGDRWKLALLCSIPVTYYLYMSTQRLFFVRFAIPMLPSLALLSGYAIERLGDRWKLSPWRRTLPAVVLMVALAQPLAYTLRHDAVLGQADTRLLATAWIDAHIPRDGSLAMESYAQLDAKFGWKGHGVQNTWVYWPEREEALTTALSGRYEYVVVSSFGSELWRKPGEPASSLPAKYRPLERNGRLLATFGPGIGGAEIPYSLDDMYTPFWHLFDRERPGPTIRIYQMSTPESKP